MKFDTVTVKDIKTGENKTGVIGVPENLDELVLAWGPKRVFKAALAVYLRSCKRRLASGSRPRERKVKISLDKLDPLIKQALIDGGVIKPD